MELMLDNQKEVKKTEFGTFPKDWRLVPIKELAKISTGDKNTEDKVSDGKYPFFVRSANVERINSYSFDGEAVLTAGDGVGTGKIFHYINGKFDYHQRVYKMSDFSSEVIGYYFYLCFSNYFYDRVMGMTAKSSVDSVRMEMIADMEIPLPPTLAEQQAIATALSDVDELIRSLDGLIQKKQAIKKGTMQQLLSPKKSGQASKKRLPGFDGEWEVKRLGELLISGELGGNYQNSEEASGFPLIKMGNLDRGKIDLSKIYFITNDISVSEKHRLKEGDVLFNTRNTPELVGKIAIWRNELRRSYYNSNLMKLEFDQKYISSNYFMNYLLNSDHFIEKLKSIATGTTSVAAIYTRDLHKLQITVPSKEEQKTIARILSDMDRELQTLCQKREKYVQVKQGMMQELLTGRVRLVED